MLFSNCNDALTVQRSASNRMKRLEYNLAGDPIEPDSLLHDRVLRYAAAAVAGLLLGCCCCAAAVVKWKTMCRVLLSLLFVVPCSHFSLSPLSVCSVSRVSRATLVAPRHARRRPGVVRRCGPLSTRIHQTFRLQVMCLFDTSFSSFT